MEKPHSERARPSAWSHAILVYIALHLLLTVAQLSESTRSANAQAIARATFQLLTCVTLVPLWLSSRATPNPHGGELLRPGVVAAFAAAVALLVDALLRLLAALTALFHARSRAMFAFAAPAVLAQTALHLLAIALFRRAPPPPNMPPGPAAARYALFARPRPRGTEDAAEGRAGTHAAALHAVTLHAVCGVMARAVDLARLLPAFPAAAVAALEMGAATCAAAVALPLLRLTARVLMHATPPKVVRVVAAGVRSIAAREGVIDCHNVHVWEEAPGVYVGTLSVRIREGVNAAAVLQFAARAFDGVVADLTVQVETCRDAARVGAFDGGEGLPA